MSAKGYLTNAVERNGPISVHEFFAFCTLHEKFGYYSQKKNILGRKGDFLTAPELTPIFGKTLGNFISSLIQEYALSKKPLAIIELGPGSGKLVSDILSSFPEGIRKAINVFALEQNPFLKSSQKENWGDINAKWFSNLETLISHILPDMRVMVLANEFLDALPINQFIFKNGQWFHRQVSVNGNDLCFIEGPSAHLPKNGKTYKNGDIQETSPQRCDVIEKICVLLQRNKGCFFAFDYGGMPLQTTGDTLQSVKDHKKVSIFDFPGEADLTSQVNFEEILNIINPKGFSQVCFETQGDFLIKAKIFETLSKAIQTDSSQMVIQTKAVEKLISPHEMGSLFKTLSIVNLD